MQVVWWVGGGWLVGWWLGAGGWLAGCWWLAGWLLAAGCWWLGVRRIGFDPGSPKVGRQKWHSKASQRHALNDLDDVAGIGIRRRWDDKSGIQKHLKRHVLNDLDDAARIGIRRRKDDKSGIQKHLKDVL